MALRIVWSLFQASIGRFTPSQGNTSLSGSVTTPVSSAISEFGILNVEAGSFASPERSLSLATIR